MKKNIILATDAYKLTHHLQYPENLTSLVSYAEARTGGRFKTITWLGLQGIILSELLEPVTMSDVDEAEEQSITVFGTDKYFNREVWGKVVELGYLPIEIKALPEGMEVPEGTPLFTIESTEPWFTTTMNALETLLMHVWYPTTIATNSLHIKKALLPIFELSSDSSNIPFSVELAVNDFGLRGATSLESAAIGGMGHLVHFRGSDNMIADKYIRDYYGLSGRAMSVLATEHSTATSYGEGTGEYDYLFAQLTRSDENAIISIVVDSYDTFNFIENVVGHPTIVNMIKARKGRVVLRPDSGVPEEQVLGILSRLEKIFGYEINSKGYKVISHNVGVIQGDGMYLESIEKLYSNILSHGYSADNLVVGSGGGLLQQGFTRDTQRFAIKACYGEKDGIPFNIQKKPKTDPTKASKSGLFKVVNDFGEIKTVDINAPGENLLKTVLKNGEVTLCTFDEIIERANK